MLSLPRISNVNSIVHKASAALLRNYGDALYHREITQTSSGATSDLHSKNRLQFSDAMAATGNDSGFQRALARFRSHLSPAKQEEFSVTSLADVHVTIAHIQEVQGSERRMRNLTRIKAFLEAMEQYGKIVEVFLNVSDILAFVWVCGQLSSFDKSKS